jgi:hypothetical protein
MRRCGACGVFGQQPARHRIKAERRAAFQPFVIGEIVDLPELEEWSGLGTLMVLEIELSTNGCNAA